MFLQRAQLPEQAAHTYTWNAHQGRQKSKKKSWPKIRAKAGEARSLISFNKLIVEKLCVKDDPFEAKLRQTKVATAA